ncbi:glycosyltransferase family 2 protein [Dendronalium sp. ChiSLP03b]|uniref:glycosyltransferase family 2 protein n=1 Tax=Dendronalium sp. ChiSLP03b TaxID=3075381 RepID=UPI002AD2B3EC|nr:glycosyltransferase [Dendronalium sp. ChiSLP03b]MDZ8208048.1 glycosyltransferase [Dendronalium sp. ChiSLP03b]
MLEPQVTIVVVPRERFSYTKFSLEGIYAHSDIPFKLIYIDANSPQPIKQYLEQQSHEKAFRLIRTENYLCANQARNLALPYVDTKYVVFIDNDVQVTPYWLKKLVQCADDTDAWVVGPLYLDGVHGIETQNIHMAGGFCEFQQEDGKLDLREQRYFAKNLLPAVKSQLLREQTQLIEFHCFLVRTNVFNQIGYLDEKLMNLGEETDFCLSVRAVGGTIYFEPASTVIYVLPAPLAWYDIPYFWLRWSDAWNKTSLSHFQQKWGLAKDAKFISIGYKWANRHRLVPLQPVQDLLLSILPWQLNSNTYLNFRGFVESVLTQFFVKDKSQEI